MDVCIHLCPRVNVCVYMYVHVYMTACKHVYACACCCESSGPPQEPPTSKENRTWMAQYAGAELYMARRHHRPSTKPRPMPERFRAVVCSELSRRACPDASAGPFASATRSVEISAYDGLHTNPGGCGPWGANWHCTRWAAEGSAPLAARRPSAWSCSSNRRRCFLFFDLLTSQGPGSTAAACARADLPRGNHAASRRLLCQCLSSNAGGRPQQQQRKPWCGQQVDATAAAAFAAAPAAIEAAAAAEAAAIEASKIAPCCAAMRSCAQDGA